MLHPKTPGIPWPAVALLAVTVACAGDAPVEDAPLSAAPPGPAMGEGTWTTLDGNAVPYSVAGRADADVTVVFVHCWMCNKSFWDAQLPALAGVYRTVTFDMPGHGEATSERDQWTVAGYGADVAGLIRELGLTDIVLVGHSMGGPVSLRAAALLPGIVRGIVAVDTLHDAEFRFEGDQIEAMMQAFETDFVGTCGQFVAQMFPEDGVEPIVEQVRAVGCDGARAEVGAALMRDFATIDSPAWFREAGVPIRAVNASAPNPTNIEANRAYADYDAVLMDDVGHYLHMTRPEAFNPLLLNAVADIVGAS
ncbi:MAG: alpha/beta hydrolase [Dehalococcoidia bacterium]|jgi:pimeloyl-ACP methyl ester carboxylesterase|nr:alpha/beta hydrolase [Dehalococcoidia bacterium]